MDKSYIIKRGVRLEALISGILERMTQDIQWAWGVWGMDLIMEEDSGVRIAVTVSGGLFQSPPSCHILSC